MEWENGWNMAWAEWIECWVVQMIEILNGNSEWNTEWAKWIM